MNPTETPHVLLLPTHLAEAIEWVLRPATGPHAAKAPDLSRLTSEQMQLLPLTLAHDFMQLALAVPRPNNPHTSRAQLSARAQWQDKPEGNKNRQRARRDRQRGDALTAAHERLLAWYIQTASAQHRRFAR